MANVISPEIYLDNDDYTQIGPLSAKNLADGSDALMTGFVVKTKLCDSDDYDAVAIDPSLDVVCAEQGATAIFRGKFEGSDLSANLLALADTDIFQHFYSGSDYHQVATRTVKVRRDA